MTVFLVKTISTEDQATISSLDRNGVSARDTKEQFVERSRLSPEDFAIFSLHSSAVFIKSVLKAKIQISGA